MSKLDPEILDRCLRRLQTGQATIDECIDENLAQADTLEPLLQLAAVTKGQFVVQGPSQSFLDHSPKRVMNVLAARMKPPAPVRKPRRAWFGQPAFRLAGIALALVLLIGSTGVASASSNALPGDGLYGIKRGLERASLVLSLSAEGDAALHLEHASTRLAEVQELIQQGRGGDVDTALGGYEDSIQSGLEIASEHRVSLEHLLSVLGKHEEVLEDVLAKASEQAELALPGLTRALESSRHSKAVIEQIHGGQSPSDLAPGQLKKTPEEQEGGPDDNPGQGQGRGQGQENKPDQPPGQGKRNEN